MKIAIPGNGNVVDGHFGHCQFYTIYTLNIVNSIEKEEILPSPAGFGCKSDIASILSQMAVSVMLAGNMGKGAVNKLSTAGLKTYRGFAGPVDNVLESYINGDIGNESLCNHQHDHNNNGHTCSNWLLDFFLR
jgi:predicted Fe-Mo cluster-binding NifX family protein